MFIVKQESASDRVVQLSAYCNEKVHSLRWTFFKDGSLNFSALVMKYITRNMIRSRLQGMAVAIGKASLGFDPKEICCHSIRSCFAMAMYLTAKEPPLTITIIGRWLREAFLK